MSEEKDISKITSDTKTNAVKTKDPRRVEAGKRLAAISKEAKKKKADAAYALEHANTDTSSPTDLKEIGLMVSIVEILVGVAGLYYKFGRKSKCVNDSPDEHDDTKTTPIEETPKSKPKTKLDSLD